MSFDKELHPFDQALILDCRGNGVYRGKTSKAYFNMIGPFGGITAALILKSVMDHPLKEGEPLSLTVNYTAPIVDGDFDIETKLIKGNRSNQHWFVQLSQKGLIAVSATLIFAKRVESFASIELDFPLSSLEKNFLGLKFDPAHMPPWVHRYDVSILKGGIPPFLSIEGEEPFKSSESLFWIKDNPERELDFLSLTAICDSFFPRIYIRRESFVPAGTLSFNVYFHTDTAGLELIGKRPLLANAWANNFYNNYFDQNALIWTEDKKIVASSNQLVYFKE